MQGKWPREEGSRDTAHKVLIKGRLKGKLSYSRARIRRTCGRAKVRTKSFRGTPSGKYDAEIKSIIGVSRDPLPRDRARINCVLIATIIPRRPSLEVGYRRVSRNTKRVDSLFAFHTLISSRTRLDSPHFATRNSPRPENLYCCRENGDWNRWKRLCNF